MVRIVDTATGEIIDSFPAAEMTGAETRRLRQVANANGLTIWYSA